MYKDKVQYWRKKPVTIQAVRWTGDNSGVIDDFLQESKDNWAILSEIVQIETLEGVMEAQVGDYIIKGINGEFYPCKPDIFDKTYELAEG